MKIHIIYTTTHHTTEKIVMHIKEQLLQESPHKNLIVSSTNIATYKNISKKEMLSLLLGYDLVILGAPIYYGSLHLPFKNFIYAYMEEISKISFALFIVSKLDQEYAAEQFNDVFPNSLRKTSLVNGFFGGHLNTHDINLFQKAITYFSFHAKPIHEDISYVDIQKFVKKILKAIALNK